MKITYDDPIDEMGFDIYRGLRGIHRKRLIAQARVMAKSTFNKLYQKKRIYLLNMLENIQIKSFFNQFSSNIYDFSNFDVTVDDHN